MTEIPLPDLEPSNADTSHDGEADDTNLYIRRVALTIAASTAPRLSNGTPPESIVANARIYEQYLIGEK